MKSAFRINLNTKWQLTVLITIASILIAVGGYFIYNYQANKTLHSKEKTLTAIATLKSKQLSNWFLDELNDIQLVANDSFLAEEVKKTLKSNAPADKSRLTKFLSKIKIEHDYKDVVIASADGKLEIWDGEQPGVLNEVELRTIEQAIIGEISLNTDLLRHESNGEEYIFISFISVIKDTNNNVLAALIGRIDASLSVYPIIEEWPIPSRTAESYLFKTENDSIVYLNNLKHNGNEALILRIPIENTELLTTQAVFGKLDLVSGKDYRNKDVTGFVSKVEGTPWYLISKIDNSEMYQAKYLVAGIVTGFVLLSFFITIFFIGFIFKRRQTNIYKELYFKEKEVWQQHEKFKVVMDSLGEGVIVTDMDAKVQYMNNRAEELTGWGFREARGRNLGEVYLVKSEETGEKVNNILEKVIKHGIVKELANHTLLVSKNGEEIPVVDTGAPVLDSDGALTGIAITFQDQTKKRHQQRQLAESERRYRLLVDAIPDTSIMVFDNDHRFLLAGGEGISKSGYDSNSLEGRTLSEVFPPDVEKLFAPLYIKALKGESTVFEHQYGDLHYLQQVLPLHDTHGNIFAGMVISRNITELILAEESLHLADTIINNMTEGVYLTKTSDGTLVYTNPKFDEMFGYAAGELIGKHVSILNAPTDRTPQEIAESIIIALNNGKEWFGEVLALRKNGATFYCAAHITSFDHKKYGRVWLSVHNDISKTRQAAEELRQANERFNKLVSELNDVVWTANSDGSKILDVNNAFESIYGITIEEYKKHPNLRIDTVHLDDRAIAEASNKELLEKGKSKAEYRIVRPDGGVVWLLDSKSLIYDSNGKVVQMGGIATDISESKQNQKFLLAQRNLGIDTSTLTDLDELYRVSMESLFNVSEMDCGMIFLFDKEMKKLDMVFSKGLSEHFILNTSHYNEHSDMVKLINLGNAAFVDYNELPVVLSEIDRAEKLESVAILPIIKKEKVFGCIILASHQSMPMTVSLQKGIEIIVTLISNAITRINVEGEIRNLNTSLEIKIKERTEQLGMAKTEADRANLAKSEFLSRMSHELRTPLNSILGFTQLLERTESRPESKIRIHQIMNSGRHLLDLINEVLDLAGIESGRITLSLEPVQLNGIIVEMLDVVSPIAKKRDVKLELVDSPLNNLFVKSDLQRLKQVLINLINNAVKYNRQGGKVEVSITASGENIRINIRDTGIGIAAEEIYKLFEPFQRIGAEISDIEGTGLGLAVAKKLVIAMNGSIGVESEPGVGSTFWIELQQMENQFERDGKTSNSLKPSNSGSTHSGTILYIEDDISNIQLVEDILHTERPNFRLVTEMYGKNAVKMATDYQPALILLDLDLPDIQGIKVLGLLQAESATNDIPVIVLSADAMIHTIEQLMAAGACYYLTKPLDVDHFLDVTDKIMNKG